MTARRNPPCCPVDTSPDVWNRQMRAIRDRTVAQRLEEWRRLNQAASVMEAASVRRRHPEYDDRQVFLALVVARYGEELAHEVWPDSVGLAP